MPMSFTSRARRQAGARLGIALCLAVMTGQITACAPGLQTPDDVVSAAQAEVIPARWQDASPTPADEMALVDWWSQFDDATLTQLIEHLWRRSFIGLEKYKTRHLTTRDLQATVDFMLEERKTIFRGCGVKDLL